jgi:hypothetical protein
VFIVGAASPNIVVYNPTTNSYIVRNTDMRNTAPSMKSIFSHNDTLYVMMQHATHSYSTDGEDLGYSDGVEINNSFFGHVS